MSWDLNTGSTPYIIKTRHASDALCLQEATNAPLNWHLK